MLLPSQGAFSFLNANSSTSHCCSAGKLHYPTSHPVHQLRNLAGNRMWSCKKGESVILPFQKCYPANASTLQKLVREIVQVHCKRQWGPKTITILRLTYWWLQQQKATWWWSNVNTNQIFVSKIEWDTKGIKQQLFLIQKFFKGGF